MYAYEGEIPDLHYFLNGTESKKQRLEIQKYWEDMREKQYIWNFCQELVDYCDVSFVTSTLSLWIIKIFNQIG